MFCLVCITVCIEDSRAMPAKENDGYRTTALLSFCRFVHFHFLFSLKGCWSRVYERVKRMRDIRWMLRCVDIDDGKALKSKTGRIELWLSEDRLKIVKRHAVDRLRSRTFCDSADLIHTRVVGFYSRWVLHLGNLIRSKLCSVDSIRILLDFFKLFIATVGWVAGNLRAFCVSSVESTRVRTRLLSIFSERFLSARSVSSGYTDPSTMW